MESAALLTLLSDFGLSDPYVGVMKGAIAQVNPALTVIDLTHQIPPQNIALARFTLMTAYPYFPAGTVHVAVVDPGVGGTRRAIAVAVGSEAAAPTGFLVGPDNGIFSGVLSAHPIIAAVELTNPHYWRTPTPSATFHGRDIFAPVGAHLASGAPLHQMGASLAPPTLVTLERPTYVQVAVDDAKPQRADLQGAIALYRLIGCIQAIDHFGNLITTIPGTQVLGKKWALLIHNVTVPGRATYSDDPPGALLALVGSHGWVEIAVNAGSAQARLNVSDEEPAAIVEIVVGQ